MKLVYTGLTCFLLNVPFAMADTVHIGVKYSFKTAYSTMKSKKPVKQLYKILMKEPLTKMQVSGHTDWVASDEINQELSEARAKTVYDILMGYGLDNVEIKTVGFGKKAPVADNNTDEGRAKNRRVSVTITNLSREQADRIVELVEKNDLLYIIEVENDQVIQSANEPPTIPQEEAIQTVVESNPDSEFSEVDKEEIQPELKTEEEPVALPISELKEESSQEKKNRYFIGVGLSQSYLVAEDITGPGLGVNAYWVSKVNLGLSAAYQWEIWRQFWFGVKANLEKQSYYDQDNTNYNWDKKDPFLFGGSLVSNYDLTRISLNLDLDFQQVPFLNESGTNVELEKDWTFGIKIGAKYKLFKGEKITSRLGLDLIYTLGSFGDYSAKTDPIGFLASLDISKSAFKNHEWLLRLNYGYTDFSHDYNTQNNEYIGIDLQLRSDLWF